MSDILTASGQKIYLGPVEAATRAIVAADFVALTPYVQVKLVESVGDYGDEAPVVTFTSLEDSRVRKATGPKDAGEITVTCGRKSDDPGQLAMIAACDSVGNKAFAFRVESPDGSVDYFYGKVRSKRANNGNASAVLRRTFIVAIDSAITEVPPAG